MQLFVQHVGGKNVANIDDTVLSTRSIAEVRDRLPADAPEHPFFEPSGLLETRFPDGRFNCWGAVIKAKERQFDRMAVGDLFLIVPELTGERGGVRQLGILRAICREPAHAASAVLWPRARKANSTRTSSFSRRRSAICLGQSSSRKSDTNPDIIRVATSFASLMGNWTDSAGSTVIFLTFVSGVGSVRSKRIGSNWTTKCRPTESGGCSRRLRLDRGRRHSEIVCSSLMNVVAQ